MTNVLDLFTSCLGTPQTALCYSSEYLAPSRGTTVSKGAPLPYQILQEQALEHLRGLVRALDTPDSPLRSASGVSVSDLVARLKPNDLEPAMWLTSSARGLTPSKASPTHDALLYIANFGSNAGYAILSADSRIPTPVVCIAEQGYMPAEEVNRMSSLGIIVGIIRTYVTAHLKRANATASEAEDISTYQDDEWETTDYVHALLKTKWHQGTPFNDHAPIKRRYFVSGPKERCLAGCLPIAIAQIMAYHRLPKTNPHVWPDIPIPWDEMTFTTPSRTLGQRPYTEQQSKTLATLLRWIGDETLVVYNSLGSFGLPRNARKFLERQGYCNVGKHSGYHEGAILKMLQEGKPVIFSSVNTRLSGHAWVIDGYQRQERTKHCLDKDGAICCSIREQRLVVHCNFGWGGLADGYYASGIFDTRRPAESYDRVDTHPKISDAHYRWHHSTITYDLP